MQNSVDSVRPFSTVLVLIAEIATVSDRVEREFRLAGRA
jgi:hypothetical protein